MKRAGLLTVAIILLFTSSAGAAGGTFTVWTEDSVPDEESFMVQEYTGTVTITFLGDCTLGGEEKNRTAARGFFRTAERNGYEYPFRQLTALTAGDDLTIANLEGVLSDRELKKVRKEYNFIGPTAYTGILTAGSVECVSLANNHSHDYDTAGYEDTRKALEEAGVACFGTDFSLIWRNDEGLMIGILGVSGSVSGNRGTAYRKKAETLKSAGCSALITVMHAGTEYDYRPDGYQKQIAALAAECGSSLIIGHHPHVVQGYGLVGGIPVVYSLGNCVFGGNTSPRDYDALAVRAELRFDSGELSAVTLRFYPISVSGEKRYNDYSPVLLEGEDAERVLKKMTESTGVSPGTFDPENGAAVTISFGS